MFDVYVNIYVDVYETKAEVRLQMFYFLFDHTSSPPERVFLSHGGWHSNNHRSLSDSSFSLNHAYHNKMALFTVKTENQLSL